MPTFLCGMQWWLQLQPNVPTGVAVVEHQLFFVFYPSFSAIPFCLLFWTKKSIHKYATNFEYFLVGFCLFLRPLLPILWKKGKKKKNSIEQEKANFAILVKKEKESKRMVKNEKKNFFSFT